MLKHDADKTLERAKRFVATGEWIVAAQRIRVERLLSEGRPAARAESLLRTFKDSLRLMHENLELERWEHEQLRAEESALSPGPPPKAPVARPRTN